MRNLMKMSSDMKQGFLIAHKGFWVCFDILKKTCQPGLLLAVTCYD